jgi:hypothetical protein
MTELFPGYIPPTRQEEDAEAIYQAYPRKLGKQDGLKAIRAAMNRLEKRKDLKETPFEYLFRKTLAYAASPAGQRGKFTPYPGTWFRAGHYDDNPAEWQIGGEEKPQVEYPEGW